MNTSHGLILASAVCGMLAWHAGAAPHYVVPPGTPGGKDTPPFDAWTNASTNIQAALHAAVSGDVVLVTNAWYPLNAELIVTQHVTLRSWNAGSLDPAGTSLDGGAERRCLFMSNAVVAGFTLSNGNGVGLLSADAGGGVYMAGGTLSNCVVAGNSANQNGGGLYAAKGEITACRIEANVLTNTWGPTYAGGGGARLASGVMLRHSTVAFNSALSSNYYAGGGGVFGHTAPVIEECWIASNATYNAGGGLFLYTYNAQTIRDCTLIGNRTMLYYSGIGYGGGLHCQAPAVGSAISNCTVIQNTSTNNGGGISAQLFNANGGMVLSNCFVERNEAWHLGGGMYSVATASDYYRMYGLYGCTIVGNRATRKHSTFTLGGGIYSTGAGVYGERSVIQSNSAYQYGGVCFLGTSTNWTYGLRNCLVADNVATVTMVGGVSMAGKGWLDACTVAGNSAVTEVGGLSLAAGASATNTLVYHNSAPTHPDWTAGAGAMIAYGCVPTSSAVCVETITDDPALANPAGGDYRLTAASPCMNRGLDEGWMLGATDLEGKRRIDGFGRRVDIGAFEFMPAGVLFLLH